MKIINKYLTESESDQKDFNQKDSVKGIVKRGNYILILRRREGDAGAGQWDLPGGGIEEGESKEDALKREVFEETGLTIDKVKSLSSDDLKIPESGVDSKMNFYTCNAEHTDVDLKPAEWSSPNREESDFMWSGSGARPEHNEYKWIEYKRDLETLPMLDVVKDVVIKQLKK